MNKHENSNKPKLPIVLVKVFMLVSISLVGILLSCNQKERKVEKLAQLIETESIKVEVYQSPG